MATPFPALDILSAMITPAVLISASGTLILSTSNRLGRVLDRVHRWSDELNSATGSPESSPVDSERLQLVFTQLGDTARRARLLQWALTAFYLAVGLFVADIVFIGVVAASGAIISWPAVTLGLVGSGLLFFGCIVLIAEARLALTTTYREMKFIQRVGEQRMPKELRPRSRQRFRLPGR
jgi:hypothetical protein